MDQKIEWAVSSTIETTQEFVVVTLLQIVVGACPLFVGHITSVAFNETKLIHFFLCHYSLNYISLLFLRIRAIIF